MKVSCPSCSIVLSGPKSAIGERVTCHACSFGFRWTDRFYAGEDFIIYDLETTGLYPDSDEFIQLAAMRFTAGTSCPAETFASYARPRRRISSFIESYTGISNDHVRDAARPEEVLVEFAKWAGAATLIAHNGLRFDSKFLTETCRRHGIASREVDGIDSIHLSKMWFGKTRGTGHSLDHLASRLRIPAATFRRHDARADVEILGHAVAGLWQRLELDRSFNGVRRHAIRLPA